MIVILLPSLLPITPFCFFKKVKVSFSFYVLLTNYMKQVPVSFLEEKPAFQVVVHQLKSSTTKTMRI